MASALLTRPWKGIWTWLSTRPASLPARRAPPRIPEACDLGLARPGVQRLPRGQLRSRGPARNLRLRKAQTSPEHQAAAGRSLRPKGLPGSARLDSFSHTKGSLPLINVAAARVPTKNRSLKKGGRRPLSHEAWLADSLGLSLAPPLVPRAGQTFRARAAALPGASGGRALRGLAAACACAPLTLTPAWGRRGRARLDQSRVQPHLPTCSRAAMWPISWVPEPIGHFAPTTHHGRYVTEDLRVPTLCGALGRCFRTLSPLILTSVL